MSKDLYDTAYFKRASSTKKWNSDGINIAQAITDVIKPKTVVDIGCGDGRILLSLLNNSNITHVHGLEYSSDAFNFMADEIKLYIEQGDATSETFYIEGEYDLVICTEVAEHIPTVKSHQLVKNLCSCGDTVVFSAAPPGQFGTGHINCQVYQYWVDLFLLCDFVIDVVATKTLRSKLKANNVSAFYVNNLKVFINANS